MSQPHILIVGVGSIGERHTRCFLNTGRATVSICETVAERRRAVASQYDLAGDYDDLDVAIHESGADAAVIASPAHTHIPIAQQLANAGIHLLIEKPLSLSLTGIGELQRTVEDRRLIASVAYCWRFHPLIEQAHRFLADGCFGRTLQIVCQSGQCFPFYRPAYREIYYNDRQTGGGAVQDAITHMLNTGEWFAGPIREIAADASHQHLAGVTVEDTVHVIARQGARRDAMGSYSLNQYQPANEVNWSIVGEGGVVRIEVGRHRWMWQDDPRAQWTMIDCPAPDRDTMYIAQANGFLDALEAQARPRCSLADGVQTLKVNLAVLDAVDHSRSLVDIEQIARDEPAGGQSQ